MLQMLFLRHRRPHTYGLSQLKRRSSRQRKYLRGKRQLQGSLEASESSASLQAILRLQKLLRASYGLALQLQQQISFRTLHRLTLRWWQPLQDQRNEVR